MLSSKYSNKFDHPRIIQRIVIIGNAGAGKTTLSYLLNQKTGYEAVNLDYYRDETREKKSQRKNPLAREESRKKLQKIARNIAYSDQWIIDGDYNHLRKIIWGKADLIIWLDYNIFYLFVVNLRRSIMRICFLNNIKDVELSINKKALNYYKTGSIEDIIFKEFQLLARILKHYVDRKMLIIDLQKYSKSSHKIFAVKNIKSTNEWINQQSQLARSV